MDKKGLIHEHSKIKLELYRLYLERYLTILLTTPFFDEIIIHDIFAGAGISSNGEKGSALIAAENIDIIKQSYNKWFKKVTLNLNDSNAENYSNLQKHIIHDFVKITDEDANKLIGKWHPLQGSHNLFFIDPHGYTQIDSTNLEKLFSYKNCDFLIFIPIFHIYRFLNPTGKTKVESQDLFLDKKSKVDPQKFYEPITKFLSGLEINQDNAKKARSVEEFLDIIINALKKMSASNYVYSQIIENKENHNKYAIFFISHNILGAEKFLEAQQKLIETTAEPTNQQSFDFVEIKKSILSIIEFDKAYTNVTIYELGIKNGFSRSDIRKEIADLEKQENGSMKILSFPGKKRKGKALYIDYEHYKNQDEKISITFRKTKNQYTEYPPML